jgi:hypothetical protein
MIFINRRSFTLTLYKYTFICLYVKKETGFEFANQANCRHL